MATYSQIQDYITTKYGLTVKTCWIAHVKELCGLPLKKSANRIDPMVRTNPCPDNMIEPIKEAFNYFGMLCEK